MPVPIIDQNTQAHSYTQLQVDKPYIALDSETYYNKSAGIKNVQKNRLWILLQGTFVVKHKYKYSCESAIYFDLDPEILKENCKFDFYYNKTDITPTVLDGGNEITLANWPNVKHIICSVNNDIPIKIPSHPYVLLNRSVLCNCNIEAENHFPLESLAAFHDSNSKLVMYFTVNTVFVNYLNQFTNLT